MTPEEQHINILEKENIDSELQLEILNYFEPSCAKGIAKYQKDHGLL